MFRRLVSRRNAIVALPLLLITAYILHTTSPTSLNLDLASICNGDLGAVSPLLNSLRGTTVDTLLDGPLPLVLDADGAPHPIPVIAADARRRHRAVLKEQTHSPQEAAQAYRQRRGRHPPPGFDAWARYAFDHKTIMVERFWDRIYHDTAPFWALEPKEIARRRQGWEHMIQIRKGKASFVGNIEGRVPWLQLWTGLVEEMARHLPDMDVPINMMDEPRVLVPWDQISKMVEEEARTRVVIEKEKATQKYSRMISSDEPFTTKWYDKRTPYWELLRPACPPNSPSRTILAIKDYVAESPSSILTQLYQAPDHAGYYSPTHSFSGYVVNMSAAADVCTQPHLRGLHGSLILPISLNTTQDLLPVFGGSKLRANNEMLIPGAMYLTDDKSYSGGDWRGPRWAKKKDGLVWRGDATGGQNLPENWAHFQRHRLVQMFNSTVVSALESGTAAETFILPPEDMYPSLRRRNNTLGTWLSSFADAGFIHRLCEWNPSDGNPCAHVDPYFPPAKGIDMSEQYRYKFLPDTDGNSFSARFRSFLLSTSLPLKATIYAEWHDDRLAPWVHYVPLDNTYRDLYGVLEFFADGAEEDADGRRHNGPEGATSGSAPPGDELARQIAEDGKVWAEKVLRREDMMLYVWRLLLEWARICDEKRGALGYVGDL